MILGATWERNDRCFLLSPEQVFSREFVIATGGTAWLEQSSMPLTYLFRSIHSVQSSWAEWEEQGNLESPHFVTRMVTSQGIRTSECFSHGILLWYRPSHTE